MLEADPTLEQWWALQAHAALDQGADWCGSCEGWVPQGRFCGECGGELHEEVQQADCPSCARRGVTTRFCPGCGTDLQPRDADPATLADDAGRAMAAWQRGRR